MSRVPPTPVEVTRRTVAAWHAAHLRVSPDGADCSGVVSWGGVECVQTGRFTAQQMRMPSGESGCPAKSSCH